MSEVIYDFVVIGGGPAGYSAAIRASQLGLTTALVEASEALGGTCLHVGCIPAKSLLFSAEVLEHAKHGSSYGIDHLDGATVNWQQVLARKQAIVDKHVNGLNFLMRKNKITVIHGYGRLTGRATNGVHAIDVDDKGQKREVYGRKIALASGSDARMIPGYQPDDRILTNIEILSMSELPTSMVVIGSGAVGVEFASVMKSFNAEVTIIEMLDRMVPAEDVEVSRELGRQFRKRGIGTHTSAKVDRIEKIQAGVKVYFTKSDGSAAVQEADKVLVAIGRSPRTYDLGLEKSRVELDRGLVKTNEWMETAEPGVYAIGDIVLGLPQLAHSGTMAGVAAASHAAGKSDHARPVRRTRIPGCTYCVPQIGSVGLTEVAAKENGYDVKVGKFPLAGNSKATILDAHDGFVKVVADSKYGEILGVHVIGAGATEIIAEAVTAIDAEMTVEEMMTVIHAHPTLSESLLDGFSSVYGMALNA